MKYGRPMTPTRATFMQPAMVTTLALIACVLFTWRSAYQAEAQTFGEKSGEHPVLFLGNESLPPLNFMKNGKPAGLVVDLVKALAERMHRPVEIRLTNWAEAQKLVLDGQADALLQINASPERLMVYDFSEPLLTSEFSIFTSSKRLGITSFFDLRGLKVGVEPKGLPALLLRQDSGIVIKEIPDFSQGFRMLAAGELDAVVLDHRVGSYVLAEKHIHGVKVTGEPVSRSDSAIAVKKGNTALLEEINAALADIRRDGTYEGIVKSWQTKEVVFKTVEQLHQERLLTGTILAALIMALIGVTVLLREVRRRKRIEATLRKSEARFRSLFELSLDGIFAVDRSGRFLMANRAAEQMSGYLEKELRESSFLDICASDRIDDTLRMLQEGLEGKSAEIETAMVHKDGRRLDLLLAGSPLLHSGKIEGLFCIARNITEQKRAEEALRESENRFRTLASASFEGIAVSVDGLLADANEQLDGILGYEPGELKGRTISSIIAPEDRLRVMENIDSGKDGVIEYGMLRKDGSRCTVEAHGRTLDHQDGRIRVTAIRDITERKRAEEELLHAKEEWEQTFNSVPDLIAVLDNNHRIVRVNKRMAQRLGVSPQECVGLHCYESVHGSLGPPEFCPHRRALRDGREHSAEVREERLGGDFIVSATPLFDKHGEMVGTVHVARDITERNQAEEALRKSEERFRIAQELSPDGFTILRPMRDEHGEVVDFTWIYENAAMARLNGTDPEQVAGRRLSEFLPGHAATPFHDAYRQVAETGETRVLEACYHGDTIPMPTWFRVAIVRMGENIAILTLDITERKRLEEELRKSRDDLELRVRERTKELIEANKALREKAEIIDLAHDAVIVRDMNGRVVFWSKGARETYGFSNEEALGQSSLDLLKAALPLPIETLTSTVLEKGEWKGEIKHTRANGERIVVDSRWAIQTGEGGEPTGFLEVDRDITAKKIAEEELRRADRAFRTLSECNQAMVRHPEEMDLLRQVCQIVVNVGGYRMAWVGLAQNDENKSVLPVASAGYDLGYLEQAEITWADNERGTGPTGTAIRMGKTFTSQNTLTNPAYAPWRAEGTRRGYAASIALPLIVEKRVIGALTIYASEPDAFDEGESSLLNELSENLSFGIASIRMAEHRRLSEEALRVYASRLELTNKELEEFAFVAAHDLQEPLRKIQTFCDMTMKRCASILDPTSRDYLDRVVNSACRMRELLRDLLQFSKVAGIPEPVGTIRLDSLAREAVETFEALFKESGCRIEIEGLPAIEANAVQMLQLFQNLIGNALKFRGEAAPLIRIYGKPAGNGACEIFVEDNGIGFDQQFAERIFMPFQRLHGRGGRYEGTGMGLAICRKIAERHGGTIRVESEVGKGSKFIVRLPVKSARPENRIE